ncbi:hypothetical protein LPY66_16900 [Dehalobacter sp. DCM]|uniref:hypothetical protein n=1 Tax=Dehalobacter sp. DCM TaxID=2907827 RepID=UPI0030812F6B|nr:hypothetical protein LPY66_16900 [Dehalobacter sp. DCM]
MSVIIALIFIFGYISGCSSATKNSQVQSEPESHVPVLSATQIDSPAKFAQAYQKGIPSLSREETAALQKQADNGKAGFLLVPDTSAVRMLNLSGGQAENLYHGPDGISSFLYAWDDHNSVFINVAQPEKKGEGGIWTVTGYSSLTEDDLYWYDDIVCFSDGLVEIMGTKIGYQKPTEAEAAKLLECISPRQEEMIMSRAVKCYIASQNQKYEDLKALCSKELAEEITVNLDGGGQNEYGAGTLIALKNCTEDKPAKIYFPRLETGTSQYSVTLDIENNQGLIVFFQIESDGDATIAKVVLSPRKIIGKFMEEYTFCYGKKEVSAEIYTLKYCSTIKLNADNSFLFTINFLEGMEELTGVWKTNERDNGCIDLVFDKLDPDEYRFEVISEDELIYHGSSWGSLMEGNIYKRIN